MFNSKLNIKKSLKYFTTFLFISSIGICNSWGMEEDITFNPKPKTWYRVANKEKLFEKVNTEKSLGGQFLEAKEDKRLHCVQSSSNDSMILWRFEKTEDGYYKIINRFREEQASPKIVHTTGTAIRLTNGEIGNKVKWNIVKVDEEKDEVTPQFYFIVNENGTSLTQNNNCISSSNIENNEESNKFQWMFFKEK
jgi:hypothetical protein